ncbi:DNA polymerase III subunit [Aquirufa regiilacus]|uniref:DNA polymerase III subunit delta n=1 Tax=Aquirufa regiilacus TaxID=3024868 RepID=A0ABU3TP30_9BACT|nr:MULTISPECIES: DNA polymerase III subunit delta [unclassified Aquirufa]MDT8887106.1 DNA polymerase III subunit delta [Aquirufa sp. LEPPI-3A]MDU0807617.1 DNA polymerase III subunit delta [Aquirufa sp. LEOWEIH-7C]
MRFQDIPGLHQTKKQLSQSVLNEHIAHAQLFHGPTGGAQLAMAMAFTSFLFCMNRQGDDACGTCPSCQKVHKGIHPDIVYLFPSVTTKKIKEAESDAFLPEWRNFITGGLFRVLPEWLAAMGAEGNKQGNIPVEETRKLLGKISLKPFEAPFKVVIIWNPESLNLSSGNALLKTLEEPPSDTLFLLICSDAQKLLTTILSRTQRIAIQAVDEVSLADFLVKETGTSLENAQNLAISCEGNIAWALEKAKSENLSTSTWFADWMRAVYQKNLSKLVGLADQFDGLAKEDQKSLLEYALHIFRQCLYQISDAPTLIKALEKEKAFITNFSKTLNRQSIEKISEKVSTAHYHLERNGRAKMIHLDLSLQIIRIANANK